MKIGVIDADLIGRKNHRFPNLACMKISSYYKSNGNDVDLILNYSNLINYDKIYISKVFTDTQISDDILNMENVEYGGTGFFFDKAPNLPEYIEHSMPDYQLYNDWLGGNVIKDYTESSIGFLTRGCFRKCAFCVNKKYNMAFEASPSSEFLDINRKTISLWDDNFLSHPKWREYLAQLKSTNKPFQFRQGLDIRLITEEKVRLFSDVKYSGDYIFAFDHIDDREIIESKLKIWKSGISKTTKLYVFCGFDRDNKWDLDFWRQDIVNTFERIKILMKYGCLPYIMRFNKYEESPYRGTYINLARWCNQPSIFKKKSYREFCEANGVRSSTMRYFNNLNNELSIMDVEYNDLKFDNTNEF